MLLVSSHCGHQYDGVDEYMYNVYTAASMPILILVVPSGKSDRPMWLLVSLLLLRRVSPERLKFPSLFAVGDSPNIAPFKTDFTQRFRARVAKLPKLKQP